MGYMDMAKDNINQSASRCLVLLFGTLHTVCNTKVQYTPYKATKTTTSIPSVFSFSQSVLNYYASLSEHQTLCCLVPPTYPWTSAAVLHSGSIHDPVWRAASKSLGKTRCCTIWMSVNHVGQGLKVIRAERGVGMRDRALGTRWSLPLVLTMETPGRNLANKAAYWSYHLLKLGYEKKHSRGLWLV